VLWRRFVVIAHFWRGATARAVRKRRSERRRAGHLVAPVPRALRAKVEMRTQPRPWRRRRLDIREAPGAGSHEPFQTAALVLPVAFAQVAIVRVELADEQVFSPGAQRTVLGADERKISRTRFLRGDVTCQRGRPRVLPPVSRATSMRMPRAEAHRATDSRQPARRSPSRAISSPGASFSACSKAERASSFCPRRR
jgi:hypothetical protein